MASYGFLFLFIATSIILFSELESVSIKNVEINTGIYVWRSLFLLITSIGLIIVAGNRYWTGSDFYTYALAYKKNSPYSFESGYVWLQNQVYSNGNDFHTMLLVMSILTIGLFSIALLYSGIPPYLPVFLYVALYTYFYGFNIMRQTLSMSIFLFGFVIMCNIKRFGFSKIVCATLTLYLSSLFHQSSLLLVPVVIYILISQELIKSKLKIMILCGSILSVFFPPINIDFIFKMPFLSYLVGDYSNYLTGSALENRGGLLRVGFMYIKLSVYILFLWSAYRNFDVYSSVQKRVSLFATVGFIIMSFKFNAALVTRTLQYFDIVGIIFFTIVIMNERNRNWKMFLFLFLIAFSIVTLSMSLNSNIGQVLPYVVFER
jgi:hypothetical protein